MRHPTKDQLIHNHWTQTLLGPNPTQDDIDEINKACLDFTSDCVWEDEYLKLNPSLVKERLKFGHMSFKANHKPGLTPIWTLRGPKGIANFATEEDARGAALALGLEEPKRVRAESLTRRPEVWELVVTPMAKDLKSELFGQAYRDNLRSCYGLASNYKEG